MTCKIPVTSFPSFFFFPLSPLHAISSFPSSRVRRDLSTQFLRESCQLRRRRIEARWRSTLHRSWEKNAKKEETPRVFLGPRKFHYFVVWKKNIQKIIFKNNFNGLHIKKLLSSSGSREKIITRWAKEIQLSLLTELYVVCTEMLLTKVMHLI